MQDQLGSPDSRWLVASIIMFVTDGFFHEQIVKADWRADFYAALKATEPEPHGMGRKLLCSFGLGRG